MGYRQLSSTEFRVTYHVLDEPVEVTVLGRVIGRYIPSPYGRYWEPAEPAPVTVIEGGASDYDPDTDPDEAIEYDRVRVIPKETK
jgi:hypothetical protein